MRLGVLFAAALVLSGCVGGGGGAPVAKSADDASNATNASRQQMPEGRAGAFAAFNETNKTEVGAGGADHRHDYWNGKDRVTLLHGSFGMNTLIYTTGAVVVSAPLVLPKGAFVFEGTGAVEITLSGPGRRACTGFYAFGDPVCSDTGTGTRPADPMGGASELHLWYRDPTSEWKDAGPVVWGKATRVAITDPKFTDMPHSTSTLWSFEARSSAAADSTLTFDANIDITRAPGEIPLWPGHPNFYADGHTRVVLQKHVKQSDAGAGGSVSQIQSFTPDAFANAEKLVSYGTRSLFVRVNFTKLDNSEPLEKPTGWILDFHNASMRANSTSPFRANATTMWTLRVGDDGMDSPYATSSRWAFHVSPVVSNPVVSCSGSGCAQYDAEFDLTVIASDEVVDVAAADASV